MDKIEIKIEKKVIQKGDNMKKVFKFKDEKREKDRVLDAIKNEIRKYVKREKKKELLDKANTYWDFDCKIGASKDNAKVIVYEE